MKNPINIFDVTNYIIDNFHQKYELTPMKLQKIIFYVYVQHLIENNGLPLFQNILEAWAYGPVFPNLYLKLQHQRNYPILTQAIAEGQARKLRPAHKQLIDKIVNHYGAYTASQLVDKTHHEDPWKINFLDADWSCNIISDADLYQFYAKPHQLSKLKEKPKK
ncbi:MAG: DUF4065 domain-containing protein ['Waltheria sp.' little leaf phytoplasma]|nr:DUF4065 domain-containing protein ['Waltheria sp.' little leaf phytoplasma]